MQRVVIVIVWLLTGLTPSKADEVIEGLLGQPAAARAFDYCKWRFIDGGGAGGLPDLAQQLEQPTPPAQLQATILAEAGTRVALAADNAKSCRRAFDAGNKQHDRALAKARKQLRGAPDFSRDAVVAEAQAAIHDAWTRDQAARKVYVSSKTADRTGAAFWAARLAVAEAKAADAASTALIRQLVERFDWIDAGRFGPPTANHAWLLVQHADADPELQQDVLVRMERYLAEGTVSKQNYAYLWDRVAVNDSREQRYGTQPDWNCKGGKLELMPVEDPAGLAARREQMGLGPVEQALAQMAASTCGG